MPQLLGNATQRLISLEQQADRFAALLDQLGVRSASGAPRQHIRMAVTGGGTYPTAFEEVPVVFVDPDYTGATLSTTDRQATSEADVYNIAGTLIPEDTEIFVWSLNGKWWTFWQPTAGGVAYTTTEITAQSGATAGGGTMTTKKLVSGAWEDRDTGVAVKHMGSESIDADEWIQYKTDEDGTLIVDVVLCPETPAAVAVGGANYSQFAHASFGEFDGTTDYIDCTGADNATGDWTLCAWVRTDSSTPSIQYPIGTTATTGLYVEDNGASDTWGFYDGTTKLAASSNLANDGTWYHLVVVKTGLSYELFQDGVSKGSGTLLDVDVTALVIGALDTSKTSIFTGGVGDIRLYAEALSDSHVEQARRGAVPYIGTLHQYDLDATFGVSAVDSGSGLDNGTVATTHPFDKAVVDFDGTDDYFDFGAVGNLTDGFTLAMWIKPDDITEDQRLFCNRGTSMGYDFYINDANLRIELSDDSSTFSGVNSGITEGVWQHVAVVVNGSSSQFYVNGATSGSTFSPSISSSNQDLYLGRLRSAASNWFEGQMRDACIYSSALSAGAIANMYNYHTYPASAYIFCPLNEGTGTTAEDASGNNRDGTGSGTPSWETAFWQSIGWDASVSTAITVDWIPSGTAAAVLYFENGSDPNADYSAVFTCADLTNGSFGLVGRLNPSDGTHVLLEVTEDGTDAEVSLYTFDGSTYTQVGSSVSVTYNDATAYQVKLHFGGSAVYGHFNGSQVIDETASFNVTKTYGGVRCESTDTSVSTLQVDA